jgi:hypothetical protein
MEDSSEPSDNEGPADNGRKYTCLTAQQLQIIFYTIRTTMVNGRPQRGIFTKLASQLGCTRLTIWRQWKRMKKKLAILLNNQPEDDHIGIIAASSHILFATGMSERRKGKFKYCREELKLATLAVEQDKRPTLRHLSAHIKVPLTTLYYILKGRKPPVYENGERIFNRRTIKLKPTLTEENKVHRFLFAVSKVRAEQTALDTFASLMDNTTKCTLMRSGFGCPRTGRSTSWLKVKSHRSGVLGTRSI